jgi:hypothetical protein
MVYCIHLLFVFEVVFEYGFKVIDSLYITSGYTFGVTYIHSDVALDVVLAGCDAVLMSLFAKIRAENEKMLSKDNTKITITRRQEKKVLEKKRSSRKKKSWRKKSLREKKVFKKNSLGEKVFEK